MPIEQLELRKGYNNGLIEATLNRRDSDGNLEAFDLTGATITVQIYDYDRATVLASFDGTVVTASSGIFSAIPSSSDLNALTNGLTYPYGILVQNATYTDGLVFTEDENYNQLECIVY